MSQEPLFSVIIPTRNRADLAANAIRSALAQEGGALAGVLVSDNSNDEAEAARLASFCEGLGDARLTYVRPPESLPMSPHWDWAAGRALELYDASHFTFLTDRMILRGGALRKLASAASRYPDKVVSYMHDRVADDGVPVRLDLHAWSGKLYEVESARLLDAVSRSEVSEVLPRLLNCLVPRGLFLTLRARYGSVCGSLAPDFSFCFRTLAAEESVLFLDEALIFHYALDRSNGASFARGELTRRDSADFMKGLRAAGHYFAAPLPGILTCHNGIIHEYCFASGETGGAKFPPLDEGKYLNAIQSELGQMFNPEARRAVEALLAERRRARGESFEPGEAAAPSPAPAPDVPLWRKLVSPRRVWGRASRALAGRRNGAAESDPGPPTFAEVGEALEYARAVRGPKVAKSAFADSLGLRELPPPGEAWEKKETS